MTPGDPARVRSPVVDPLAPAGAADGGQLTVVRVCDRVARGGGGGGGARDGARDPGGEPPLVVTPHFELRRRGTGMELWHHLTPATTDDDLTGLLSAELFGPGWLTGHDTFARVFVAVVRSCDPDPLRAWRTFYANTLRRIQACWSRPRDRRDDGAPSSIAGMAPVYREALRRTGPGTVLDLGSCFGFFPLLLAGQDRAVVASDLTAPSMRLLGAVAAAEGTPLRTLVCDATNVPLPDAGYDVVTSLHLLEHLEPPEGARLVAEAVRLARRRAVLAVPFETMPNEAYGHVRAFDLDELDMLGRASGRPYTVDEHHGGWLVIDTSDTSDTSDRGR